MQEMTQQAREGYSNTLKSFFEPAGEKIKPDMTFQAQVEVMNNVLKTHSKSEFWIFCDSWRVKSLQLWNKS